jgi:hypothetical protein
MNRWEIYEYPQWIPLPESLSRAFDTALETKCQQFRFVHGQQQYELDLKTFVLHETASGLSICVRVIPVILDHNLNGAVRLFPFTESFLFTPQQPDQGQHIVHDFSPIVGCWGGKDDTAMHWEPHVTACMMDSIPCPTSLSCITKGSQEYNYVVTRFSFEVNAIFRLQNISWLQKYNLKKKDMLSTWKATIPMPEEFLWHGAVKLEGVKGILAHGFDRMYSHNGLNRYGKGCYFAKSSTVSDGFACLAYNMIEQKYVKLMFLVKVLVGHTTKGTPNMYPPPNIPGTHIPYDTAVDDQREIFVTFSDYQTLPMYLISYN